MQVEIDPAAEHPPFEQLRRQVVAQIADGVLAPGDKLPPVRQLAASLGLAANTVARAYRELEAEGYVITGGRAGTMVAHSARSAAAVAAHAESAAAAFVTTMRSLGLTAEQIAAAVSRALTSAHR